MFIYLHVLEDQKRGELMQTNATLRPMGATIPRDDRQLLNATLDLIAAKAPGYVFNEPPRHEPKVYVGRSYH